MEAVLVAKADDVSPGGRRRGPKPADPSAIKSISLNMRVKPDWREWVDGLAEFDRSASFVDLVDKALVAYARQIGYDKLPPKR